MRISGLSSDGCSSDLRAGEAYRRTPRGRGARRQRPRAIRASWRPQGRGASFRSDLQALDAARGGHVAAVLAGEARDGHVLAARSEEHTSELQSLMRKSYAVICMKKQQ